MSVISEPALLEASTNPLSSAKPTKLADAAKQFEALMINEMLKSAREAGSEGWLGSGDDSGSETAMGMAETQFAQAMANRGGLGLAKIIERSMSKVTP